MFSAAIDRATVKAFVYTILSDDRTICALSLGLGFAQNEVIFNLYPKTISFLSFLRLTLFCCAFLLASHVLAQEPAYIHYGVDQGLPSSEVYDAIQDDDGFMWFATDRGLVRFDGYEFKVFGERDGLSSEVVFGFHQDHKRRIWMFSYTHAGLNYIEDGKIHAPAWNEQFKKGRKIRVIVSMHVDRGDTIWLGSAQSYAHCKIDPNGNVTAIEVDGSQARGFAMQVEPDYPEGLIFGSMRPERIEEFRDQMKYQFPGDTILIPFDAENTHMTSSLSVTANGAEYYAAQNRSLVRFNTKGRLQSALLPSEATISAYTDRSGNVWVGMFRNGAFRFDRGDLDSKPHEFLSEKTVSRIYEDREGGIWFTTTEDGIYYSPSLEVMSEEYGTSSHTETITTIHGTDSNLWIGTKHGKVYKRSIMSDRSGDLAATDLGEIYEILGGGEEVWVCMRVVEPTPQKWSLKTVTNRVACEISRGDGLWLQPEGSQYLKYSSKLRGTRLSPEIRGWRTESMCTWNHLVYAGFNSGLAVMNPQKDTVLEPLEAFRDTWIIDIESSDEHLFLSTKDHRLLVYDGSSIWDVTAFQQFNFGRISKIAVQNDQLIWIGGKKGIARLKLDHQERTVSAEFISRNDGLISNEVNDIEIYSGKLWVATQEGITFFPIDHIFEDRVPPRVHLEEVNVNGMRVSETDRVEFDHQSNVFDFKYVGVSFRNAHQVRYRYRLKGYDQQWTETLGRQVRYMLPPGTYSFEVMGQSVRGLWSETPAVYSFRINSPIWQRSWFVFSVLVGLIGVFIAFFYWRLSSLREKTALELKMARSQQQALNAQLKPHFIFNALNSVHNYIRKNDKVNSGNYLLLFSRLIRQILENSHDPLVKISEELALVEKYLELEKLRFKDRMTFSIEVDSSLDAENTYIPTQLVQPYVENAIWHGLMNKDDAGHIRVSAHRVGDSIVLKVEDDGVGREAAREFSQGEYQHASSGMEMNEQRLRLIEALYDRKVTVEVSDVTDDQGLVAGTLVTLTIPIIQK